MAFDSAQQLRTLLAGLEDFPLFPREVRAVSPRPAPAPQFCISCGRHRTRRNVIDGQIIPGAPFLFVSSMPLESDDISGQPFQGAAGEMFERMLSKMDLNRGQISLTYLTKCFAPAEPSDDEIAACLAHLKPQLEAAKARCIVAMGTAAARTLSRTNSPLAQLRGRAWDWNGTPVIATHDLGTLLARQELRKETWTDMQKAMQLCTT